MIDVTERVAAVLIEAGVASEERALVFAQLAVGKAQAFRDRLLAKIDQSGDCWLWTAARSGDGYGNVMTPEGKVVGAHRVVYQEFVGSVPAGFELDHLCRNRACVNPEHLELVTKRENILRGEGVGAKAARRDHCPNGHSYTSENTQFQRGARVCATCRRERWAARSEETNARRRAKRQEVAA